MCVCDLCTCGSICGCEEWIDGGGGAVPSLAGHPPGPDSFLFAVFVSKNPSSQLKDLSGVHFAGRFLLPLPSESD